LSKESLKNRVYEYVQAHPNKTEDEIAEALGVSMIKVLEALLLLQDEGLVKSQEIEATASEKNTVL